MVRSIFWTWFVLGMGLGASADAAISKPAQIATYVEQWAKDNRFSGVVLAGDRGEVIYQKAFGYAVREWQIPNTLKTRFQIGSATKQFTAYLVLKLAQEGKLTLDSPISTYLNNLHGDWSKRVTVHHLLSHTSGLPHYKVIPDYRRSFFPVDLPLKSYLDRIAALSLTYEPGARFSYSSFGYILLGAVLEAASGRDYGALLDHHIFKPFGLKDTFLDDGRLRQKRAFPYRWHWDDFDYRPAEHRSHTTSWSTGGVFSTAEDLFRWDRAIREGAGLAEPWRGKWFEAHSPEYAYGWVLQQRETPTGHTPLVYHDGALTGYTAEFFRLPDRDQTFIMLSNTRAYKNVLLPWKVVDILCGKKVPARPSLEKYLVDLYHQRGTEAMLAAYERERQASSMRIDKKSARDIIYAGLHLLNQHDFSAAENLLRLAVRDYPDSIYAHYYLGQALSELHRIEAALASYQKALKIDGDNAMILRAIETLKGSPSGK